MVGRKSSSGKASSSVSSSRSSSTKHHPYKQSKSTTTTNTPKTKSSNQQFRSQSATHTRSHDLKNKPTRSDQQSCHKVTNSILGNAYHNTSCKSVKNDIMGFAHSRPNIMYSSNNANHSKMERDLSSSNYHASSVHQKGSSMKCALTDLKHNQNSSATSHIMRETRKSGDGYNAVVAGMDKRTFNAPAEKKQIDIARRQRNLYF